jgi:hypothetical protein
MARFEFYKNFDMQALRAERTRLEKILDSAQEHSYNNGYWSRDPVEMLARRELSVVNAAIAKLIPVAV